jgi:hypothetical protein
MADLQAQTLKNAVLECVDRVGLSIVDFPWEDRQAYGNWLAQTHYFVRHTTSFLGLTASRFGHWQRELQYRQLRHLREESDHDLLLLNDLKTLRFKLQDFEELPETAALYQMQYYFIEHENPASHFGYAYCLEGLAAKKIETFYERVESAFSPEACSFLRVHMTEDKEHFDHGLDVLKELTPAEADSFRRNLQQTSALYIHMLEHIKKLTV